MLFNSLAFAVFFPTVSLAYFVLPHRWRWAWLLAASAYFYMAFIPVYILILAVTILIDYAAAIGIERTRGAARKALLVTSIVSTCSVLFVFKYFDFVDASLANLASFIRWNYPIHHLGIILPIGLSFHTFQSLSYVVEVYRGNQRPERHLGIYALYVMFFPQLVAGPIERPQNLLHQFRERHVFDYDRVTEGLALMLWGFFKKTVLADRLAPLVGSVFDRTPNPTAASVLVGTVFFAYQIYCDFSGYSDIAIGSARVLGFGLMENFHRPYAATSVGEFWKRWHISLSTWFRDYVYIPLGGNRGSRSRWFFNLFVTFLVSGLWHGANWTFVVWGALNGGYLVGSIVTAPVRAKIARMVGLESRPRVHRALRIAVTFALTCQAWIFFRAPTVSAAARMSRAFYEGLGDWLRHPVLSTPANLHSLVALTSGYDLLVIALGLAFLETVQWLQRRSDTRRMLPDEPIGLRWGLYYGMLLAILVFGAFTRREFIYFQF